VLLDAWQPHGAIWLPFGPLVPVLPGLAVGAQEPVVGSPAGGMTRRYHISRPRLVAACAVSRGASFGPVLDPRRRCRRERLPQRDAPARGSRHRRSGACRRRLGAGAGGRPSVATANVSSARVESGPDFKGDTGLSQSG